MKDRFCGGRAPGLIQEKPMHPVFRFQLEKEHRFFGTGANRLLHLVRDTGSLLTACREMNMSYSKGRKIVARMESELGFRVVESRQGGKAGGFSMLTPQAEELIEKYDAFTNRAEQILASLFDEYF